MDEHRLAQRAAVRERFSAARAQLERVRSELAAIPEALERIEHEHHERLAAIEARLEELQQRTITEGLTSGLTDELAKVRAERSASAGDLRQARVIVERRQRPLSAGQARLERETNPEAEHAELFVLGRADLLEQHAIAKNRAEWSEQRLRAAATRLGLHASAIIHDAQQADADARQAVAEIFQAILTE